MKAKCKKNSHSWATKEHHSNIEFCRTTDTSDFKLKFVNIFNKNNQRKN